MLSAPLGLCVANALVEGVGLAGVLAAAWLFFNRVICRSGQQCFRARVAAEEWPGLCLPGALEGDFAAANV